MNENSEKDSFSFLTSKFNMADILCAHVPPWRNDYIRGAVCLCFIRSTICHLIGALSL